MERGSFFSFTFNLLCFYKKCGKIGEVYYADKGGTNESRYNFSTKNDAEIYAKSLGGTLATVDQLTKAHAQGMDICWLGWASDGQIYR